jgi:hypothetical protein
VSAILPLLGRKGTLRAGAGAKAVLGGGGGAAPVTDNILVANRGQAAAGVSGSFSTVQTYKKQYQAHPAGAISKLKTVDVNWYLSSATAFTGITSHQIKRSIEYPVGVFTQVLWGGNDTKTIGTTPSTTLSDEITISIPAGAKFWVHTAWLAGTPPVFRLPANGSTLGLDDRVGNGDLTATGGEATNQTFAWGPAAIIGSVAAPNAQASLLVGDSICYAHAVAGTPGDISSVGSGGGAGYMARFLDPIMPYCKIAYPGAKALDFVSLFGASGGNNRVTFFMSQLGYTRYWIQLGVNDLGSGGRTPAQLLADNQTLAGYAKPGALIDLSTLTPQSSSTDAWATQVNQTPTGGIADKNTYDDLVRAVPAWVTGRIYDAADAAMTARNNEIWKTTGGAWTIDGTHPNSLAAAAIAAAL